MSHKLHVGARVLYKLSAYDVESIMARRLKSRHSVEDQGRFYGNTPSEGQVVPAVVTCLFGNAPHTVFNGQAMLDGNDTLWITSVQEGTSPGTWSWPVTE